MLVDSHCHLDYLERDGDLDEVVGDGVLVETFDFTLGR